MLLAMKTNHGKGIGKIKTHLFGTRVIQQCCSRYSLDCLGGHSVESLRNINGN